MVKSNEAREKRWLAYFKTPEGLAIVQCILKENPMWKTPDIAARNVANIYSFNSNRYDIKNGAEVILLKDNVQVFAAVNCIAKVLNLKISE
jgi:hypothetical protein